MRGKGAAQRRPPQTDGRVQSGHHPSSAGAVGIAGPQFGHQLAEFGQPDILQQILRRVHLFQPGAQGIDDRLIGETTAGLKGPTLPDLGLRQVPDRPFLKGVDQTGLTDPGCANEGYCSGSVPLSLVKCSTS